MSSKYNTNFYDILGVSTNAAIPEIEKAFRALSLKHHPDKANAAMRPRAGESPSEREVRIKLNNDRYARILEARSTLTDDEKREAYDRQQGIGGNPSFAETRKTKDRSQTTAARAETKRDSKDKSKSRSKSKPTTEPRVDDSAGDAIESFSNSLAGEIRYIGNIERQTWDMLHILRSTTSRALPKLNFTETISLLEGILRRIKIATEEIEQAIDDILGLASRQSLTAQKKTYRAACIYDSTVSGELPYIRRAAKMIDELRPVVMPLQESWRWE